MTPPADDTLERPDLASTAEPVRPVIAMLVVMWASEIADVPLDGRLDRFGIRPRRLDGLDGVVLAPFLHGGFGHLIANTLPFLVLGAVIALGSLRRFAAVTVVVGLIIGLGTWLTGPSNSIHISVMLTNMTFVVDEAPSGQEGIEMVSQAAKLGVPYEIAFVDWQMPGLDGIETGKRILALSELGTAPHLVMVLRHTVIGVPPPRVEAAPEPVAEPEAPSPRRGRRAKATPEPEAIAG